MVNYHRPTGRISTCPSTQGVPQVSEVYTHGENLPVSKTSFRTDVISTSFHRHHSPPGGTLRNQGHQSDILLRRYPGAGEDTEVIVPAQRLRIDPTSPSGVQTQQQEVSANAFTGLSLPGIGMEYNNNDCFSPTGQTRSNTTTDLAVLLRTPTVCMRDCMALLGKMNFASTAIPLGRLHCRPLQFCLPRHATIQVVLNKRISLSQEALDSLHWWMSPIRNGRTLKMSLATYVITTDASLTGWGAQMGQQSIHGRWTDTDRLNHINYLELKTVLFALQQWKNQLKNQTVLLQLDNTTAVANLLKEGGTQSRSLHYLAAEILTSADLQNISVRPSYLPGQMNTQANALSRSKGTR